jgi:MFS transporter, DHA3 family, macrolide efflux protein
VTVGSAPTAWSVIRGNSAYRFFLASTLISFMGSTVHVVAASWLILRLTGAAYSVPLLLLFSALPGVLLAPLIGALVDRVETRALLIGVDLASGATVLVLPLLAAAGRLQPWNLYVAEFVLAFLGQLYGPASKVFVGRLARADELLAANATVTVVYQLGIALGALAAGALVAVTSPAVGLLVNSVSFLVSAFGMVLVGRTSAWGGREVVQVNETNLEDRSMGSWLRLRALINRTYATAFSTPRIAHLTALFLWLQCLHRLLASLLAPFVASAGAGPGSQGALQMGYSLGAVAAGALVPVLAKRLGQTGMLLIGSLGTAVLVALFPLVGISWVSVLVYAGAGLAVGTWIYDLTAAQQEVPAAVQGRYFAATGAMQSLGGIGIFLTGSVLLRVLDPSSVYLIGAGVLLTVSLPSIVLLRRHPATA